MTNQPIRGQYPDHVTTLVQSETSICHQLSNQLAYQTETQNFHRNLTPGLGYLGANVPTCHRLVINRIGSRHDLGYECEERGGVMRKRVRLSASAVSCVICVMGSCAYGQNASQIIVISMLTFDSFTEEAANKLKKLQLPNSCDNC